MARSGSYGLLVTGGDIVRAALRTLEVVGEGQTASAESMKDGLEAFNLLLAQCMSPSNPILPGLKVWLRESKTLTLSAKAAYSLKASGGDLAMHPPVRILSAVRRNTDNEDAVLSTMDLDEFMALPSKSQTGTPNKYLYERKYDEGTLTLDVIPYTLTDTIVMICHREIQDLDGIAEDVDVPREYFRFFKFALAIDLAPEYGMDASNTIQSNAANALTLCQSFTPENSNLYFQPDAPE